MAQGFKAVSINNLTGSPALPPPGARQTLIDPFSPDQQKKLKWHCKQKAAKMHCFKQHSFCSSRESRSIFCNNETKEQIRDCIAALAKQKTADLNLADQASR